MIESILSFIAVGTFWFWAIMAIFFIATIISLENNTIGWPVFLTVVVGAIYYKDIFNLLANWQVLLVFFLVYVSCGVAWSFYKWLHHVKKYIAENKNKCKQDLKNAFTLDVSYNKARIIGWIVYWPCSAFWTLTGDFFTNLFDMLRNSYQNIVDKQLDKLGR